MTRYQNVNRENTYESLVIHPEGEWVRYEDQCIIAPAFSESEVGRLQAELARKEQHLQNTLRLLAEIIDSRTEVSITREMADNQDKIQATFRMNPLYIFSSQAKELVAFEVASQVRNLILDAMR